MLITIVRREVQVPPEKNTVPPEMTLLKTRPVQTCSAKRSDLPKIKFPVDSHLEYVLQKVFKMTGVKITIGRLSLIGIY